MSDEVVVTNEATGGMKGSKPERYDLIPTGPLRLLARLYGKGCEKYAVRNWERGYDWSLSYASAQRHLNEFWDGNDLDDGPKGTGMPHVICAAWHCFALAFFMRHHPDLDDRPTKSPNNESKQLS